MNNSLARRFGEDPKILTNGDMLAPVRSYRSLLTGSRFGRVRPHINPEPPFINEKEAIALDKMEGIERELPTSALRAQSGEGLISTGLKLAGKLGTAAAIGRSLHKVATGPIGTFVSNKLSERFNKNPEWRPGFPGEAHLVLPTRHGLTRANFCGPGTNLLARLKRGDRGVSQVDTACSKHDMLYHLAKTPRDIRAADNELRSDISASDAGRIQKGILRAGIKAKTLGEDVGIFNPETFTKLPGLQGSGMIPNISGEGRSLESRNHRMHVANMACSLVNRIGSSGPLYKRSGDLSGLCQQHGRGHNGHMLVSNPQEATDLSKTKHHDPNIANISGRKPAVVGRRPTFKKGTELIAHAQSGEGIISSLIGDKFTDIVKEVIEKPAHNLRRVIMKDLVKARRKRGRGSSLNRKDNIFSDQVLKGSGMHGGQFGILASLAASFIIPKIIDAISGRGRHTGKGMSGKGPRDQTIANLVGRGRKDQGSLRMDPMMFLKQLKKKKNPGHALGEKLLKMHGLTPAKLHRLGLTEKHLIPIVRKFLLKNPSAVNLFPINERGKGQSGGQFGILASLAASFVIPKIIDAISGKKVTLF